DRRGTLLFAALPLLSIVAVAITPNGIYELTHPVADSVTAGMPYISEYEPPSVKTYYYSTTLLMLGFVALAWARPRKATRVELGLFALGAAFAVQATRTVTIAAVLITPLFARALDEWLPVVESVLRERHERLAVYGMAALSLAALAAAVPSTAHELSKSSFT